MFGVERLRAFNMTRVRVLGLVFIFAVSWASTASGVPMTRFTVVDSSPTSWVARGLQDYTVTPELGWTFDVSRNFDNSIGFDIFGPALPGTSVSHWFIDFAAPFDEALQPGFYPDFERWPFQAPDRPGLAFGSSGRLDNRASGFFEILEVTYGAGGSVFSFAADFTHYGETNVNNYAIAELRFNAGANAAPEPSSLLLVAVGGCLCFARRGRANLTR